MPRPNAAVIRFTHLHPCHSPQTTITGWIGEPESSHVKSATDRCRIRMVFGKALNRPAGCAEPDLQQALRFVATKPLRLARMRSCPSADLGRPRHERNVRNKDDESHLLCSVLVTLCRLLPISPSFWRGSPQFLLQQTVAHSVTKRPSWSRIRMRILPRSGRKNRTDGSIAMLYGGRSAKISDTGHNDDWDLCVQMQGALGDEKIYQWY